MTFAYLFAICLVVKERNYQLPAVPSRGHGIVLLLFFTLAFIAQNLALVNINSKDWWFDLKTKKDKIEMGLFVTRYVSTLFMFVLGLKAPGITSIANEDEENLVNNENEVRDFLINPLVTKAINNVFVVFRKIDRHSGMVGRSCEL